ncbi:MULTISPECIES: MurR/RpiR family transcriptional regulator [Pseudothermotoga]|uniref:MurR/RpiR family transcriptional regulator n=1 Tax=Pseudothermotoga TaxID=1643951 RepID=UPI0004225A30|nr:MULTISPECIES: MurR/RpiR family transcriptional regulator [Pseudothermotoga]KUK20828.1 MAG: Transcriptional regulator, RpiR family [Pseudothermotoga lettingae]MDI3494711.1 RpiR family transcriptional regulator, carbohydrate utilization regulator [Pseudothermotoga sp.]MDK2885086.1 RpiR family transcriptional regulator, carbohydrate utilization regulator [Pseudothermotoga sp.]HBJ82153.1 MurR/RpiR family transcriptional regulator [Pseudothermotoga sp.]HBT26346.1 MurR/RpiR family transcriptional
MIFDYLLGIFDRLSDSEKKVAMYILERPDDVIHYSITEFARVVDVSETTIYRVIKKMKFKGYQAFKIELIRQTSGVKSVPLTNMETLDEYVEEIKSLAERMKTTLKKDDLQKAADWIVQSQKTIFFGVGLSSVVAEYGSLLLSLLGFSSFCYNDPHVQVIVATGLCEKDLVISVSHSGNIRDTVKSTQVARDVGARTVAVTAGINSPLSSVVDIALYSPVARFEKYEFLRGNLGEMAVLEILFKMVLKKIYGEKESHLNDLSEVLKPKMYSGGEQ